MEPLGRPEIPNWREPGSGSVWDEVVVSLDDIWAEESGDDGGELLNGDFGGQVDPCFVQGFLDCPEEGGRGVVQARDVVELCHGSCGTKKRQTR